MSCVLLYCQIFLLTGIAIDAKTVREYSWKAQIKKLFERGILDGDSSRFTDILHGEVFDANYRSVNKAYEQYVLSVGDFDERVMLIENQNETGDHISDEAIDSNNPESDNSKEDIDKPPSIIHPNTLTPLTGRQYLKNRDSSVNVGSMTPMMTAKECVIRLHTMFKCPRIPLHQSLKNAGTSEEAITEIENEIKFKVSEMIARCQPSGEEHSECNDQSGNRYSDFTRKRLEVAEKLFLKMIEDIAQEEVKMGKPDVGESLRQDLFLRSLFACAVEIIVFSHGCSQLNFPWILDVLQLPAYHFYKIIELVVRTENQLSRDMVKHLNMLEERVLDSMSWTSDSPLWKTIEESNMPVPICEEVCLPHQLSTLDGSVQRSETLSSYSLQTTKLSKTDVKLAVEGKDSNGDGNLKPKRGGSLGLFFRKFYHLASVRMQDLCQQLNISDKEVRLKIWTCFEYVIVNSIELMRNRHLDQILMCTVYVACKVLEIDLTFQEIMKCYRTQPQSASHIYRSVLLTSVSGEKNIMKSTTDEERGDLIKFYNSVYVKVIQNFALKFSSKSNNKGEPLMLSPLPVSRSKGNSPYRRISDKHPIFIRCLDNSDNILPSPVKPLSYYFSRSPAKDLHAINNMIQINSVKRSLNTADEEGPAIKKFPPRNDSSKLQDLIGDRRTYKL